MFGYPESLLIRFPTRGACSDLFGARGNDNLCCFTIIMPNHFHGIVIVNAGNICRGVLQYAPALLRLNVCYNQPSLRGHGLQQFHIFSDKGRIKRTPSIPLNLRGKKCSPPS
ncbi:MAG: hypothetical protein C4581_07830 [Nitrospiraceae bacterium]|nr:MAG: hypothetical protein C4581_07830 [Nitrospiraceae bacterium]